MSLDETFESGGEDTPPSDYGEISEEPELPEDYPQQVMDWKQSMQSMTGLLRPDNGDYLEFAVVVMTNAVHWHQLPEACSALIDLLRMKGERDASLAQSKADGPSVVELDGGDAERQRLSPKAARRSRA